MAYSYTVTKTTQTIDRIAYFVATITETDATITSEWQVSGVPNNGNMVLFQSNVLSGTAAETEPSIAYATGDQRGTQYEIGTIVADPVTTDHNTNSWLNWGNLPAGILFGRSNPDAGSDNAIVTKIVYRNAVGQ